MRCCQYTCLSCLLVLASALVALEGALRLGSCEKPHVDKQVRIRSSSVC